MTVLAWVAIGSLIAYAALVVALLLAGRRETARAVAGFVPDCVVMLRGLLRDPRVPRRHRFVLIGLVAYLLMPIDLVPDFIPVAGQLDDAVIVALALRLVLRAAGRELVTEHWPGPDESLRLLLRVL